MSFLDNIYGPGIIAGPLGFFAGSLFGGSKKEAATQQQVQNQQINPVIQPVVTVQPVVTQPNTTTTNTFQNTYDYSQQVISNSPGATMTTKKQVSPASTVTPTAAWSTPFTTSQTTPTSITPSQSASQTATAGDNSLIWIAAIVALGAIGYGYVSKPSKTVHVSKKGVRGEY